MRDIRASSAPMMDQCPASGMAQEGEITVGSTGRPAIVGSTVHAISRQIVEEHLTHVPDVEPYMIENGLESEVDHSELEMLSMFFLQSWREMKDKIANVVCEAEMKYPAGDIMITGHTDIKGVRQEDPHRPVIADIKSGWKAEDKNYIAQLKAYGWLALQESPEAPDVTLIIIWLRDRTTSTFVYSREEIEAWMAGFIDKVQGWKQDEYEMGDYCLWCPRKATCPGRLETLRSGVALFSTDAKSLCYDENGQLLPVEKLISTYEQAKMLAKVLKAVQDQIKEEVVNRGPMEGGGRRIYLKERKGCDSIDARKAWPVMSRYLTDEEIAPAITIGKSALTDAVANKAEKGGKKKAIDIFTEELKEAGAITEGSPSYVTTIEDVKEAVR